ncbi:MAG TPA: patatin-like phospholipase family protein [Candidatus Limnocylindrales bacterium]|nr:patatin-like phospholipase family protein [Candidatus Limnocylindrales bacterium]
MQLRSFVFLTAALFASACFAQDKPTPPTAEARAASEATPAHEGRLKIGVALEGGGALGEAHIGVLKWFEEHHIPIDYLAGTSMGGLVAGFYATGKTGDELRDIVKSADWTLLLRGETPYQDLSFRRKEDARDIPNSIQIGLKDGASLPPGLNSGHQVNLLIDREVLPYSTIKSFDELPIPFRCVSTELVSGKPYVFRDGSLSDAMRATMSIPGVFDPVRHGDQIYVDGGLVDNLPTDVVRNMGADIVIAVHLQLSPVAAKEIQSAFSILGRSIELVIANTEIRGLEGADVIVRENVEKYTSTDYDKVDELEQIGYEAAEDRAALLKPFALDDAAWAEYEQVKQARIRTRIGIPQFVRVEGVEGPAVVNIHRLLAHLEGKPIKYEELDQLLTRLTGVGRYDSITYDMVQENGQDGLVVRVHEKAYAPPVVRPTFQVDGTQTDNVTYTLGARFTFMDFAGFRSEWRTDVQVGQTYGIASELYRPFTAVSRAFFAPFVNASQSTFFVYGQSDPKADYRLRQFQGGLDLGYSFSRFSELRVGYGIGYNDATLRLGTPDFSSYTGRVGALHVRYTLDLTDEAVIPTRGIYFRSNFNFYETYPNATQAFPSLEVTAQYFQPVFHRDSAFAIASGGTTFSFPHTGVPQFFLGGVGRLSAYGLNELGGNQYFLGRAGYLHKVFTLPPFVGKQVYLVGYGELGKMYGDPLQAPRLSIDGASGLLAETALGPVFVGGSVGDSGHEKWFFQLGRVF